MVKHHLPKDPDARMTGVTEHVAHRTSWDCQRCLKPWPCDPAREEFRATMSQTECRIMMWGYLEEAAEQLRGLPFGEIFARFFAWTP